MPLSAETVESAQPNDATGFEQARAHFLAGLDHLSADRLADAEQAFAASLTLLPDRVSTLVNLAAVRLRLSRPDAALEATRRILAIEPDNVEGWFHQGDAMVQLSRWSDALPRFERAAALAPNFAEPWFRHGQMLQRLDRDADAMRSYRRAVAADTRCAPAWTNIGTLLRETGRTDEAAEAFRQARAHGADDELNGYYLAAVGAGTAPAESPALYVETLFDDYAPSFASHVVDALGYRAHRTLAQALAAIAPNRRFQRALDLGCGTGLCGALLKPYAEQLCGVDLSGRMLAEAGATGAYDALAQQDIVDFMQAETSTFDLIAAADVFIYVGDLAPAFAAARRVLTHGGIFCFSVELASPETTDFQLLPSLRYAHSEHYLRALAATHGLRVVHSQQGPIRHDQRQPIAGLYLFLTTDDAAR